MQDILKNETELSLMDMGIQELDSREEMAMMLLMLKVTVNFNCPVHNNYVAGCN